MSVVGWPEFRAAEEKCWRRVKKAPQVERAERYIECMRQAMKELRGNQSAADVVEKVYKEIRQRGARAPYCPPPDSEILRAVVAFVVDRVARTKGELVSIPVAPVHRLHPRARISAKCVVAWLGLEDCVVMQKGGKAILRLSCVKEKLGI